MSTPEALGRYRVESVLGAGAFGTVYRGHDDALDVPVAIKVLGQNWSFDPEIRSRFVNEAQLLRRVDGTRVVRVHDIGQTEEGQPFFVMDFADRGTMEDRLHGLAEGSSRPVAVEDLARFARLLAAGVGEVHRLGVAHRDLKPSNLLLRSDRRRAPAAAPTDGAVPIGEALVAAGENLIVSDLGLARDLMGPTRLTSVVGTPGYMAPEQLDPSVKVDQRADIFACTAILHRVLTGAPPEGPLDGTPGALGPDVPAPVVALLERGLAADREQRFATTDDWLDGVERALDTVGSGWHGVEVTDPLVKALSSLGRSSAPPRRASAPPPGGLPTAAPDEGAGGPPAPAPRSRRTPLLVGLGVLAVIAVVAAVLVTRGGSGSSSSSTTATEAASKGPLPGSDPVAAAKARFVDPIDAVAAPDGSVYVVEYSGNRVRRVAPDGTVTTVAGTGRQGYAGDGGPARQADFDQPTGLGMGHDGSLLVSDSFNGRVRRIATDGTVATVAGNGKSGKPAVGRPAAGQPIDPVDVAELSDGSVVIADGTNARVWRVGRDGVLRVLAGTGAHQPPAGGSGGTSSPDPTGSTEKASEATFVSPASVAVDAHDRVYVSDIGGEVVRRIDPDGTIVTVAGTGVQGSAGDGGPATSAQLHGPDGITVDGKGRVVFADTGNQRVRRIESDGTLVTVAGSGTRGFTGDGGGATKAQLAQPASAAVLGDGRVVVVDGYNNRLRVVSTSGTITELAGSGASGRRGDNGPATGAVLSDPEGIVLDSAGRLYIAEGLSGEIRQVGTDGTIHTVAGVGSGSGGDGAAAIDTAFNGLSGMAIDNSGDLYTAEIVDSRIRGITPAGTVVNIAGTGTAGFSGDGGPAKAAQLNVPAGLAVSPRGLVVADGGNGRVRLVTNEGVISTIAGSGATGGDAGATGPATGATLALPYGVAAAPDGSILVTEAAGERVRRIAPDGTITSIAGTGEAGYSGDGGPATQAQLNRPAGVAVAADGTVYVAEQKGNRIRAIAPDGTITTVAGTGEAGFSGDGGKATRARLSGPTFLAIEPGGSLLVSDSDNDRVRRIDRSGVITTVAGGF